MTTYLFLASLVFNFFWVFVLTLLHVAHRAYRHVMFWCEMLTLLMFACEINRELSILFWGVEPVIDNFRIQVYAIEHVLLGLVLREAWLFYEKATARQTRNSVGLRA